MKICGAFCLVIFLVISGMVLEGQETAKREKEIAAEKRADQCIVWTSGDREVAEKMVLMYAFYSRQQNWIGQSRMIVWGPSQKLLTEDKELQEKIGKIKGAGVELYACKACADMYGIADKLSAIGVKVMYTGKFLADMLAADWKVLTF